MTRYRVHPSESLVTVEVKSTLHDSHIRSAGLTGFIDGELGRDGRPDLAKPHRAVLRLPVSALRSGNPLQDVEMERRMDTRRHPNIGVKVTTVAPTRSKQRYRATADVTAKGRTVTVEREISIIVEDGQLVVEGNHVFDMRDFGISPPRLLLLKVEPEARVSVRVVARS